MKYTEKTVEEYIKQKGGMFFWENERIYQRMILELSMQDASGVLSKYFQVNVRYLWMKEGLIKPKNKNGDLLLFTKGPEYIMNRSALKKVEKKTSVVKGEKSKQIEESVNFKDNARKYKSKLRYVTNKFHTKYAFTCGICEKRKRLGMGFYTKSEEFFLCNECMAKYQLSVKDDIEIKIYSTPMGGASQYKMKTRRK